LLAGAFTIQVRNPGDTATDAPAVTEVGGGLYYFDIAAAFTTTHGVGVYQWSAEVNNATPFARAFDAGEVRFQAADSDDLAQPGDAMDLVVDAVDAAAIATDAIDADAIAAGAIDASAIATDAIDADAIAADAIGASELATSAVDEIRDAILSDSTPFPGANIDAAISTRAVPGDAMDLLPATEAGLVDQVWDEDIVAAHGGASAAGLLLRALGAAISARVNNATLDALLGVADTPGTDLPEQVDTELSAAHGAGDWQGISANDWTAGEREQIRDALGVDGTKTAATGGSLEALIGLVPDAVWSFTGIAGKAFPAAGRVLDRVRVYVTNRNRVNFTTQEQEAFEDDGTTPAQRWPVTTQGAELVTRQFGIASERGDPLDPL
jgi:hypothetical protein